MCSINGFLILTASIGLTVGYYDSLGYEFVFVFPTNEVGEPYESKYNSLDILVPDESDSARVEVRYSGFWPDPDYRAHPYVERLTVRKGVNHVNLKKPYYTYINLGLNYYPDARIRIISEQLISVVANNYRCKTCEGDSWTVLPVHMAGTHYSVGLVDADYASKAQSMVYLIPTEDNTDVTIRAIYEGSEDQFNVQSLQVREGSKLYMFGVRKKTTLFVDSSKPILLSVGVQSVEYGEHSVDYGSFMPTPLPNLSKAGPSDCGVSSEDDTLRFADLQGQWNFMITPYNPSCESFNVMLHTSNGNTQIKEVNTSSLQYPIGLDDKASHHYVGIKQPIGSSVHVASLCRYATTGIFDNGFFLDNVPTISQWVTGTVMFTTMLEKESVVIFGDKTTKEAGTLDSGQQILWESVNDFGGKYYYGRAELGQAGFHKFISDGHFTLVVSKNAVNFSHAHGYTPAINSLGDVHGPPPTPSTIAPSTTLPTNTSTAKTPTTTTTVANSTTTTTISTATTTTESATPTTTTTSTMIPTSTTTIRVSTTTSVTTPVARSKKTPPTTTTDGVGREMTHLFTIITFLRCFLVA